MKTIADRYFSFKSSMPDLPAQQAMDMAEQDDSFYKTWADFQQQHPCFQSCRLVIDDALADRPEWRNLQAEHPRFCMYYPMEIERLDEWRRRLDEEEGAAKIEELETQELKPDLTAAATLSPALSRAQAGKKTSLRAIENITPVIAGVLWIAFAVTLVLAAALTLTFYIAQTSSLSIA